MYAHSSHFSISIQELTTRPKTQNSSAFFAEEYLPPMRLSQFLLLVIVTLVACSNNVAIATNAVQISNTAASSNPVLANESRRYLKGSKKKTESTSAEEEERFTPQFSQYLGVFKFPKNFANFPVVKQLAQFRNKFGKNGDKLFKGWFKFRFNRYANAQM